MIALSPVRKWLIGAVAALVLLPLLLLFTPPGLALVGRLVEPLSGGRVSIEGLGGFSPGHLHARTVIVRDAKGEWLRIEDVSLNWSPLAALGNHIAADGVTAARITVARLPVSSEEEEQGEPTRIDVEHLSAPRIAIAPPVIGHAATLSASGSLHYLTLHQFAANIAVARDNGDVYRIDGGVADDVAHGSAAVREGPDGILAALAGLPGMGPVNLSARASGTRNGNAVAFTLSAGPLSAEGHGTIALAARRADLDFTAAAPAMTPQPGMRWKSLGAEGHLHGGFDTPSLNARLTLDGGEFSGVRVARLAATLTGDAGRADLGGSAEGVVVPGADLFAQEPVTFEAHADLKAAARPVRFALKHPLAALTGTAQTRGAQTLNAQLSIPSLASFAVLTGLDVQGSAAAKLTAQQIARRMRLALNGSLDTKGTSLPARLLGRAALDASATLDGGDITDSSLRLNGAALKAETSGNFRKGVLNYRLALSLSNLSRLAATVQGNLALRGSVNGPPATAGLAASGEASIAAKGFARQRVAIDLKANGLPSPRSASLAMTGRLNGAPLAVHATLGGGEARKIDFTARWKSLNAKAGIALPDKAPMTGQAHLALARLADIAVFAGTDIAGAADAAITLRAHGAKTDAAVQANLKDGQSGNVRVQTVAARGAIADLLGTPNLDIAVDAHGLAAQGVGGDAAAHLAGPLDRLAIRLDSALKDNSGAPASLAAAGLLNLSAQRVTLTALNGNWRNVPLSLTAPVTIDFAKGLALDRLAARLGGGEVTADGSILPKLALNAAASGIGLDRFKSFLPQIGAQGTLAARATLSGTLAAPEGLVTLTGHELRTAYSNRSLPSATLDAQLSLHGDGARVTAKLAAGSTVHFDAAGEVPLKPDRAMMLHAEGGADLAALDSVLAPGGRRARGTLAFNADIAGTLAAPRVTGQGKLSGGQFQDYAQGLRIRGIEAALTADGSHIRVTSLTARAGTGTLSGSGGIDLDAPGMPVDFAFTAKSARPMVSDLFTAIFSGEGKLSGPLNNLSVSGDLRIERGDINLPENFPPEVATLNVRRRGEAAAKPPSRSRIALALNVRTDGPIFVRGHGVDAEMGGEIRLSGTVASPVISGDFRMTRGSYDFAGQRLDFTSGRIGFDGMGLRGRLDPSLDFTAQTVSGGVTAVLTVGGYASAPKITLSSTPQLPQDEVLAHLLFQQSVKQLSPLQMASIAQAIGSLGGVGSGFDPLGMLRRTVGLDRLSVGSTTGAASGESQTTVEAGRYVMRNVYVGVKQNLSGGTQTQVQVDLTRHLKAQATVAANTAATATKGNALEDNGSSVGLSYQFEY